MKTDTKKSQIRTFWLSPNEANAFDAWTVLNGFENSQSEALRFLVNQAVKDEKRLAALIQPETDELHPKATVRLSYDLWNRWLVHCKASHFVPSQYLAQVMQRHIDEHSAQEQQMKLYIAANGVDYSPKKPIMLRLTDTEYQAVFERSQIDGYSPAYWIVHMLRVALTGNPALTEASLHAVNEANKQMRRIGTNFNQLVRRVNMGARQPYEQEIRIALRIIDQYRSWQQHISELIWNNINRWNILDIEETKKEWQQTGRKLKPWSKKTETAVLIEKDNDHVKI